jgi:hypothetical protein
MRYVLGSTEGYDQRLRTLIGFFVTARVLRDELVLGVNDDNGAVTGVVLVTLPGERPSPERLNAQREEVWRQLGPAERQRYEAFGAAAGQFTVEAPHHHLNMVAVLMPAAGSAGRCFRRYTIWLNPIPDPAESRSQRRIPRIWPCT